MATRFIPGPIIRDKSPETIINEVILRWVGNGFGEPKTVLADNKGKFANEENKDMCANLERRDHEYCHLQTMANVTCERYHAVVDNTKTQRYHTKWPVFGQ